MPAGSETPVLVYDVGGSHVSTAVCLGRSCRLGPSALKDHAALVGAAVAWFNNSGSANDSLPHSAATHVDAG